VPQGIPSNAMELYIEADSGPGASQIVLDNLYLITEGVNMNWFWQGTPDTTITQYRMEYKSINAPYWAFGPVTSDFYGIIEKYHFTSSDTYEFRIQGGYDDGGNFVPQGIPSNAMELYIEADSAIPGAVFDLISVIPGANVGDLYVQWTSDTTPELYQYKIYYDTMPGVNIMNAMYYYVMDTMQTQITINGLEPGETYYVKMVSFDMSMNILNVTNEMWGVAKAGTGGPIPGSVFDLISVTPGANVGDLYVQWTSDTTPELYQYKIYYDTMPGVNIMNAMYYYVMDTMQTQITINGLEPGETYYVKMVSFDMSMNILNVTNEMWGVAKAGTGGVPSSSEFSIYDIFPGIEAGSIVVKWNPDTSVGVSSYRIYYDTTSVNVGQSQYSTPMYAEDFTVILNNLEPGVNYKVRVVSLDNANQVIRMTAEENCNAADGVVDYNAPVWLGSPGVLSAEVISKYKIRLSTSDVDDSSFPVFFKVYVSENDYINSNDLPVRIVKSANGYGLNNYEVSGLNLLQNKDYFVFVRVTDAVNNSEYNNSYQIINLANSNDTTAPIFNMGNFVVANNTGTVDLNWSQATDNFSLDTQIVYHIYKSGDTLPIFTTMADSTPVFLFKFGDTVGRDLFILAEDEAGNMSSDSISIWVQTSDNVSPTVPQNLQWINIGDNQVALKWDSSSDNSMDPIKYIVFLSENMGPFNPVAKTYANRYIHKFTYMPNTPKFKVAAVDFVGNQSMLSNEVAVTLADTNIIVDSTPPLFTGIQTIISGSQNNSVIISLPKPADTNTVYLDVFISNPNMPLTYSDSVYLTTIMYNPNNDTDLQNNNIVYQLTGISGYDNDYEILVTARDQYGNKEDNFEKSRIVVSDSAEIIQNFAFESFYDLSALPIGRDISF
ncbi:MAG TPA: fibronectin type III domain-containing protein, partial [bacterium]|nr:fibronectin type III domain-containing protein [bacterium]